MRHSGEKPYKCPHCQYASIQSASLKSHMKSQHSDKDGMYICQECNYKTLNRQVWNQHLKDHENDIIKLKLEAEPVTKKIRIHIPSGYMSDANRGGQNSGMFDLKNLNKVEAKGAVTTKEAQLIQTALSMISQQRGVTSSQSDASSSNVAVQIQSDVDSGSLNTGGQVFIIQTEPQPPNLVPAASVDAQNIAEVVTVQHVSDTVQVSNMESRNDMPLEIVGPISCEQVTDEHSVNDCTPTNFISVQPDSQN